MVSYILRRIISAIPTILIVITLVFFILRLGPGGPAYYILGQEASEQAVKKLNEQLGLNRPLYIQYFSYLRNLFHGNLGKSLINGMSVVSLILSALPYSLELTIGGLILSILIGVPLGLASALNKDRIQDHFARIFSLVGMSLPSFYIGILLIVIFSVHLGWLPVMGGGQLNNFSSIIHLILPAGSLGLFMVGYVTRLTRSSVLEILREDYITTARSKGLKERIVIYKHMLRNALIPLLTVLGIYVAILVGSSVLVETVFSRPGLGKLIVGGIKQGDFPVIQSLLMFYTVFITMINLAVDISYAFVDPRIQYQ